MKKVMLCTKCRSVCSVLEKNIAGKKYKYYKCPICGHMEASEAVPKLPGDG